MLGSKTFTRAFNSTSSGKDQRNLRQGKLGAWHHKHWPAIERCLAPMHTSLGHARGISVSQTLRTVDKAHKTNTIPQFTHLTSHGEAQMVKLPPPFPGVDKESEKLGYKRATSRTAIAQTTIAFSSHNPHRMLARLGPASEAVNSHSRDKGDVLAVARVAGIQAAKATSTLIPLCHNIPLSGVNIDISIIAPSVTRRDDLPISNQDNEEPEPPAFPFGGLQILASVHTHGQTGVEMEALVAASVAGLTVYDMCKAVDRGMRLTETRVVEKTGGQSGDWKLNDNGELQVVNEPDQALR